MPSALVLLYVRGSHMFQTVLSIYGGLISYGAITNLSKYEKTAEKLAEWSKEAANQLKQTRTTQAAGAVMILASFVVSIVLAIWETTLPTWARVSLSPAMLVGTMLARSHIKNYWTPKDGKTTTKIPLPKMEDYNEAQSQTETLLKVLEYLEYSWVISSFLAITIKQK